MFHAVARMLAINLVHPASVAMAVLMVVCNCGALTPNQAGAPFPQVTLQGVFGGAEAVTALGSSLPAVAAWYGYTPDHLRDLLLSDSTLHTGPDGRLFFACQLDASPEDPTSSALPAKSVLSIVELFKLHSRPGASRKIYLDFDGHVTRGTSWNTAYGAEINTPAWDIDNSPGEFTHAERQGIEEIWRGVSEKFSMFHVDVTTEDPGVEALRRTHPGDEEFGIRACFGGSNADWFKESASGVAYVGTFTSGLDVPCFIFAPYGAKTAAHEIGHTMGLSHDGTPCCSPADHNNPECCYYSGHGHWGPIMGSAYRPVTHWSRGEYEGANNQEDDLVVMQNHGLTYIPDDHDSGPRGATVLSAANSYRATGVISTSTDHDGFLFTATGGVYNVIVRPNTVDPSLHLAVYLYDSAFDFALSSNDAGGVILQIDTLPNQQFYFYVDGVGFASPATNGYSDYGSLGQYSVAVVGVGVRGEFICQPQNQTVAAGESATFYGEIAGAEAAYAWQISSDGVGNWMTLYGDHSPSLTLHDVQPRQAAYFRLAADTPAGRLLSSVARLTVDSGAAYTHVPRDGTVATYNSGQPIGASNIFVGFSQPGTRLVLRNGFVVQAQTNVTIGSRLASRRNTVELDQAGTRLAAGQDLTIGSSGSFNQLTIQGGGSVLAGGDLQIGESLLSRSNVLVLGGLGSRASAGVTLAVGSGGSGNFLSVSNGALVTSRDAGISMFCTAVDNRALVTGAGSTWTNLNDMFIGQYGSLGNLTLSQGARIHNGRHVSIGSAAAADQNALLLTGPGTLFQNGRDLAVGASGFQNRLLVMNGAMLHSYSSTIGRNTAGGTNLAVLAGPSSLWSNQWDVTVGAFGSGNTLLITNGGSLHAMVGRIGSTLESSNNLAVVSGADSSWISPSGLMVGNGLNNRLWVTNGGRVEAGSLTLGVNLASTANSVLVRDQGSALRVSGLATVGSIGASNTLRLLAGAFMQTDSAEIGNVGKHNVVSVEGTGAYWENAGDLIVGNWFAATDNSLAVVDGAVVATSNLFVSLGNGADRNHVTVAGGSLFVTNPLATGVLDVRRGSMIIDSGTVRANTLLLTNATQPELLFTSGHLAVDNLRLAKSLLVGDGSRHAHLESSQSVQISSMLVVHTNSMVTAHDIQAPFVANYGILRGESSRLRFLGNVENKGTIMGDNGIEFTARLDNRGRILSSGSIRFPDQFLQYGIPITPTLYACTNFAGLPGSSGTLDGLGSGARLNYPVGLAYDRGFLYVADYNSHTIRKISPDGQVTTIAGTAGVKGNVDGTPGRFNTPQALAVDRIGRVFVADTANHTIREIGLDGRVRTLAGRAGMPGYADGANNTAQFNTPVAIAIDSGFAVYVAEYGNHTIRKIEGTQVTTLAGLAGSSGFADGAGAQARFKSPQGITLSPTEEQLFIADSGNHTIRRMTREGVVSTLAGLAGQPGGSNGVATAARFNNPIGLTCDFGGSVYVADYFNSAVRKVTMLGAVSTVAGGFGQTGSTDGVGTNGRFATPAGLAMNVENNTLFIADSANHRISRGSALFRPLVVTQPESVSASAGAEARFSVVVHGTPPFAYQWRRNGQPLPSNTNASLLFQLVATTDAGEHDVVVTGPHGFTTSAVAKLDVKPVNAAPPNLSAVLDQNRLVVSWPADRLGWQLLSWEESDGSLWKIVPGSSTTNRIISPVQGFGSVLFRLVAP